MADDENKVPVSPELLNCLQSVWPEITEDKIHEFADVQPTFQSEGGIPREKNGLLPFLVKVEGMLHDAYLQRGVDPNAIAARARCSETVAKLQRDLKETRKNGSFTRAYMQQSTRQLYEAKKELKQVNAQINPEAEAEAKQETLSVENMIQSGKDIRPYFKDKETPRFGSIDLTNLDTAIQVYRSIEQEMMQLEDSFLHDNFVLAEDKMDDKLNSFQKYWTWLASEETTPDVSTDQLILTRRAYNSEHFAQEVVPMVENHFKLVGKASLHFGEIDNKNFENRSEEDKKALLDIVKDKPKETIALYMINNESHNMAEIFGVADLKTKLSLPEVRDLADKIDIKHLNKSMTQLKRDGEIPSLAFLGKNMDISAKQSQQKTVSQVKSRVG